MGKKRKFHRPGILTTARAAFSAFISMAPLAVSVGNDVATKNSVGQTIKNAAFAYGIDVESRNVDWGKLLVSAVVFPVAAAVIYKATGMATKRFSRALKI